MNVGKHGNLNLVDRSPAFEHITHLGDTFLNLSLDHIVFAYLNHVYVNVAKREIRPN